MDFYAELIEARQSKNPEHRLQLLDYEKRKAFELRISELEAFIREHLPHTARPIPSSQDGKNGDRSFKSIIFWHMSSHMAVVGPRL